MFARGAVSLALLAALVCAVAGPTAAPAAAGADVCPEPNDSLASACFLGPGGAAPGFLDSPDDVDGYRVELPAGVMLVASLGSLPADYSLRVLSADGGVKGEAVEPGLADKVVKLDGLPAGSYYLAVFSERGGSNPDQPYLVSVAYPASLALGNPTAPTAPDGAPRGAYGYVPAPARSYGLQVADVGAGFREVAHDESEDGRFFASRIVSADAFPVQQVWFSRSDVGMIDTAVLILPYGSNDEVAAALNQKLDEWRSQGINVQPAEGWGSEQVYSYAAANSGVMYRGIALKHRNAVVFMEMLGLEQHATWDRISGLMRIVESRIWAAAQ